MSTFLWAATPVATAGPDSPLPGLLLMAAGYFGTCAVWPHRACRRCKSGRRQSPTGRAFRRCPTCNGTGRRDRAGTVVLRALGWGGRR